ncbi:MAG TPA: FecR domain-containing protein [Steroidobacteraceae bacterium]|nr:FecR domain-containing protein [Steroidobacteraceae bacterium]
MTDAVESGAQAGVLEAALRWHAATVNADCDWDAFTLWLEADPAHQRAYAQVAELEARLAQQRPVLQQQLREAPAPGSRRWWGGAAAAAVLLATLFFGWQRLPLNASVAQDYVAGGEALAMALDAGVKVTLAPGSRIRVSGHHQEKMDLTGTAYFDVPHDPGRTLAIVAGGYVVHDIGTRFEISSAAGELKLAVAEGEAAVDLPGAEQQVRVAAGQQLLVSGAPLRAEYASIAGDDVAGWRAGRLVFHNEPLTLVAAQVSLHAGRAVTVDEAIAQRRFSGVLTVGDGSQLAARLGEIMGLAVQVRGNAVHLAAADSRR